MTNVPEDELNQLREELRRERAEREAVEVGVRAALTAAYERGRADERAGLPGPMVPKQRGPLRVVPLAVVGAGAATAAAGRKAGRWVAENPAGMAVIVTAALVMGLVGILALPGPQDAGRPPSIAAPMASATPTQSLTPSPEPTETEGPTQAPPPLTPRTHGPTVVDVEPHPVVRQVDREPAATPQPPVTSPPPVEPSPASPPPLGAPPGDEDGQQDEEEQPAEQPTGSLLCVRADVDPVARAGVCVG